MGEHICAFNNVFRSNFICYNIKLFLRLKDPKITFTTEGILFDEYIQGMVKWEEIAHINFGRKVRMRKPSKNIAVL